MKTIEELLNMKYMEVVKYLKNKYGSVSKNYFSIKGNKTGGIGRGNEGLYIHHIDEDKMIMLSRGMNYHRKAEYAKLLNEEQFKLIEIDFQKADRLVYCDLLEHLLLHLKIIEEPKPIIKYFNVGTGGAVNFIIPELNDIYSGIEYKQPWKKVVINSVINRKDEYFKLLKYGVNKLGMNKDDYYRSFNVNFGWNFENNEELFNEFEILFN